MFGRLDNSALPETARYGYIPGLDGLRAIAVMIVVIAHMGFEHIVPGGFGVTVFFFISGFLITRLLLAEHEDKGRIGLKAFYIRRFARLYPALLFMVFATMIIYPLAGWGEPKLLEFLSAVFYGTNIYRIVQCINGATPFMPWGHLWSLAVEEHFYLIFPLFMVFMNGRWNRTIGWLLGVIVAAFLWRMFIYTQTDLPAAEYSYIMTDARLDSLAWGCLLSVLLHKLGDVTRLKWLIGFIPFILAAGMIGISFLIRDDMFRYTARFSLQGAAIFVLTLNLYYLRELRFSFAILEWKPIAWVGMVSYALYLWHIPIIDICERLFGAQLSSRALGVVLSFGLAAVSYYYVEKPFMALRKKFGSHTVKRGGGQIGR